MKRIMFVVLFFVVGCGGGSGDSSVQVITDPVSETPMCSEILDDRGAIRLDLLCNEDGFPLDLETGPTPIGYAPAPNDSPGYFRFRCIRPDGGSSGWSAGQDIIENICADGFNSHILSYFRKETPADNFETCPNPDELTKFVDTLITGDRFTEAPVLSFASSSTDYHRRLVRESVSLSNRALPDEYDITESGEDVEGSDGGALSVPEGEIYVQFFPERTGVPVGLAVGRYIRITGGAEHEIGNSSALRKSYVLFIAHEIMHVLGFSGHISLPTDSIMMEGGNIIRRFVTDREWPREEILSSVDVWGIRYLYV